MKKLLLFSGVLLFCHFGMGAQVEMNFFDAQKKPQVSGINILDVSGQEPTAVIGKRWSLVVRIESRDEHYVENRMARLGTGVVIGRFRNNDGYSFRGKAGFLVLTANHVLLNGQETEGQRLTFFDENRQLERTVPFYIVGRSIGEDLALLEVEVPDEDLPRVDLPKLALFEPSELASYQWIPHYFRINPGDGDHRDLSYVEIAPKVVVSTSTRDAVNSLSVWTDDFWYIGGDFSPGMSGGPVFVTGVFDSDGQRISKYGGLLVGLLGYIFDRSSEAGYAYPITQKSLEQVFVRSGEGSEFLAYTQAGAGEVDLKIANPYIQMRLNRKSLGLQIKKKTSPDYQVADELEATFLSAFRTEAPSSAKDVTAIRFRQVNDYYESRSFSPTDFFGMKKQSSSSGLPGGGGVVDGTPGGGSVIDGSPGGGGVVDGSPGGFGANGSSQGVRVSKVNRYEVSHGIEVSVFLLDGTFQRAFLDRVEVDGQTKSFEFLKSLLNTIRSASNLTLFLKPSQFRQPLDEYSGTYDFNLLKAEVQPMKDLGYIVPLNKTFKGKVIRKENGITLSLSAGFRDTKIGLSHQFSLKLGIQLDPSTRDIKSVAIEKYFLDERPIEMPRDLRYYLKERRLRILYRQQSLIEVDL